jgi:hypothetical protein
LTRYEIKRLIIALDFSDFDDKLIENIFKMSNHVGIEQLYFVHVVKTLDMPGSIAEKYPDLIAPQDEAIKNQIEFNIQKWNKEAVETRYDIDVLEGNITEGILRWAQIKNVGLILLGHKANRTSLGVNSGKIAKLAPCSVGFFSGQMPDTNKKIGAYRFL